MSFNQFILFLLLNLLSFSAYNQLLFPGLNNGIIKEGSFSLNLGQSIPFGKLRASKISNHPFEVAKQVDYGQSWDFGINQYFFKKIGMALRIANYEQQMDQNVFARIHNNTADFTESYLPSFSIFKFSLGVSTFFKYQNFVIEPQIMYGFSDISINFTEAYLKNTEGEIEEIYRYDYAIPSFGSLNGSVDFSYMFNASKGRKFNIGLNLVTQLMYMKPEIKYQKTFSNRDITEISDHTYHKNLFIFYYATGIILRLGE